MTETSVWICDYARTAFGRYGGGLSTVRPDDLAAGVLRALIERTPNLDPSMIDEVIMGCANQAGEDNRNVARMAALLAGLPETVPGTTLNRLCGSGLDAVGTAARAIKSGEADIVIAGGVESMSRAPFVMAKAESAFSRRATVEDTTIGWRFINLQMQALYGTDSMPETAENVATDFGISREDQDRFALRSQQRAEASRDWLAQEIVPVAVPQRKADPKIIDKDEHPRAGTTFEALGQLRPIVRQDGTVTAGNSSGVNDGAAALILASERVVDDLGLEPMARVSGMATAGVAPRVMGIGPVPATLRLCDRLGIAPCNFDLIELNEAFAAQGLAVLRQLGIAEDAPFVNPHGGAIALGHPLGASGARLAGTIARKITAGHATVGLATMCVGVGQGVALAITR